MGFELCGLDFYPSLSGGYEAKINDFIIHLKHSQCHWHAQITSFWTSGRITAASAKSPKVAMSILLDTFRHWIAQIEDLTKSTRSKLNQLPMPPDE